MPLPLIMQVYIVCASIGSLFLLICAFMGATHHSGTGGGHSGHIGQTGHTGIGHSGASGHTAIGHSGASGHAAGGHGGHSAGGHGGHATGHGGHSASGHTADGGSHSNSGHGNELVQAAKLQARTGPFHAPNRKHEVGGLERVLGLLNPTVLTTFLAFFGLTGLFFMFSFPILGWATLAPAFIGGFVSVKVMTAVMNAAFSRMYSSTAATENDLIGHMAEVTVPITIGRTGEVTYIVSSKRYTSPARAVSPDTEIPKGTKVFIADRHESYVLVDLWTDSFMDPAFEEGMLTPEEKLAKKRSENAH